MILTFCTDSSHLGRLDYSSFSQQFLMEMMIAKITNKGKICGYREEPKDISEWRGVKLNKSQEIIEIRWGLLGYTGEIDLDWMPPTVQLFWLSNHSELIGSLDTSTLPSTMRNLFISNNAFSGTLDMTKLPSTMTDFTVKKESTDGTLDLTYLPRTITKIDLHDCRFHGTVNLTKLPDSLETLDLGVNALSGPVDLTHLPHRLSHLSLADNGFSGETDFSKLPVDLLTIDCSKNDLSGTILVEGDNYKVHNSGSRISVYVKMHLLIRNDSGKMLIGKGNDAGTTGYVDRDILK